MISASVEVVAVRSSGMSGNMNARVLPEPVADNSISSLWSFWILIEANCISFNALISNFSSMGSSHCRLFSMAANVANNARATIGLTYLKGKGQFNRIIC